MKKLLVVLSVGLLLGAEEKKDDGNKDSDKVQGTWVAKSAERGGKPVDLANDKHIPAKIVFKGDKVTVHAGEREHTATFKLGHEGKLGTIDMTPDEGDAKDHSIKALYRFKGDTLEVCVNEGKIGERPREFGTKEGAHTAVVIFTHEKK
jgi:uncharacterized protein (TIGR03067 family)